MASTPALLVEQLRLAGVLSTPSIADALLAIDRKDFVLPEDRDLAYRDEALAIGHGQTISQPYTVAFMLELLNPQVGEKILDVGSGSGWTTALLGFLVGQGGRVYGVERIPELVEMGIENVRKYPELPLEIKEAGEVLGFPERAPYDRILVSAEVHEIPKELLTQLRIGGAMVIPFSGTLAKITKTSAGEHEIEQYEGFAFVPLIK